MEKSEAKGGNEQERNNEEQRAHNRLVLGRISTFDVEKQLYAIEKTEIIVKQSLYILELVVLRDLQSSFSFVVDQFAIGPSSEQSFYDFGIPVGSRQVKRRLLVFVDWVDLDVRLGQQIGYNRLTVHVGRPV